jgi:hypothetical protein
MLTQGPVVKIGRPPPPAAPKSGRGMRPVVPPKVAGQDSAWRCRAGAFDATPPENLTQVFRSWGPRIPRHPTARRVWAEEAVRWASADRDLIRANEQIMLAALR